MLPLTKVQTINYIKKNDDCLGNCDTCLLRERKLREIGVKPIPESCADRFLIFVRKITTLENVNKKILDSCTRRQNFLYKLTKKSLTLRLLPNED